MAIIIMVVSSSRLVNPKKKFTARQTPNKKSNVFLGSLYQEAQPVLQFQMPKNKSERMWERWFDFEPLGSQGTDRSIYLRAHLLEQWYRKHGCDNIALT